MGRGYGRGGPVSPWDHESGLELRAGPRNVPVIAVARVLQTRRQKALPATRARSLALAERKGGRRIRRRGRPLGIHFILLVLEITPRFMARLPTGKGSPREWNRNKRRRGELSFRERGGRKIKKAERERGSFFSLQEALTLARPLFVVTRQWANFRALHCTRGGFQFPLLCLLLYCGRSSYEKCCCCWRWLTGEDFGRERDNFLCTAAARSMRRCWCL